MFDIGFSEIFVILVVALIVIGPERLPKVARTLGHLFGRMQRYVNDVKSDIAREMELEDLRKLRGTIEDAGRTIEESVRREMNDAQNEFGQIKSDAESALDDHAIAPPAEPDKAPAMVADEPSPQLELELKRPASGESRKQA
jgi:sec-independent protein translocase protein TatB